jgi:hypothetical protein
MAGKVRHLINRSGRYHARLVVPKELRGIICKTELRSPLGGDYRQALSDLAPISPNTQAVAFWAAMNSRGERHFSPECGWFSL